MYKYTIIMVYVLLLFLIPGRSFSWFSASDDTKPPGFAMDSSIPDTLSNTYVLQYNTLRDGEESAIFQDSGNNAIVFADRLNIDIPLSILSKEAIEPEESLDRLLAVNLRIQNILDEYLAHRKRSELLLKNLRIPYLEKPRNQAIEVKPESAMVEAVLEGEKLKKDIENIVRHGVGYIRRNYEQVEQFLAGIHQIKETGTGINTLLRRGNNITPVTESEEYQKLPGVNVGGQSNRELPWIIRFLFGIPRYIINNKVEIAIWLISVVTFSFVVLRVAKR